MTGQDLLDRMSVINGELQVSSGGTDVTRSLIALNMAQDYFETLAAARGKVFGSSTGTVTTTANVESTAFPAGVLRIDRLQRLGANSLPTAELFSIRKRGAHSTAWYWPINLVTQVSTGAPLAYETDGTNIYWAPMPDATYTIRYYGFAAASDIAVAGTFAYPDICATPIAAWAAKVMKIGVDDAPDAMASLAQEVFKPVLDVLALFQRDGGAPLEYTRVHNA